MLPIKLRVTVSGVICPFLYATFRLKRVNYEEIWNSTKEVVFLLETLMMG